jgi:O-antigen/teichoic acid export membrane protein
VRRLIRAVADCDPNTGSSLGLTLSGFTLRAVQALTSFVTVILLARALGAAGRGEFFLFLAALAVITRLADLGMSPAAVVYAGRFPQSCGQLHRLLLRVTCGMWVAMAVLATLALALGNLTLVPLPIERCMLALLILPLTMYEQVWIHLMVGMRRVLLMNLVLAGGALLNLSLVCVLVIWQSGGLEAALLVIGLVALAKAVAMLAIAARATRSTDAATSELRIREIITFGLRGYPNSLAALLWTRLPGFVLAAVHGPTALGVFSVAQQSVEQILLPAQSTQDAIYQRVTWLDRTRATAAMNQYLRVFLGAMVLAGLLAATVAPLAFASIFGEAFAGSASVFQILLISAPLAVVPALLSPYFLGQLRRPGVVSLAAWGRVGLALVLSLWLAPPFAGVGVALALVMADLVWTAMMLRLYVRLAATPLSSVVIPRANDIALLFGRARALLQGRA